MFLHFLLCLIFLDSFCFFVLLWHTNQLINYIFLLIPLQLTGGGYVCQNIEASSENNAASNHSSDCYDAEVIFLSGILSGIFFFLN